MSDSFSSTDTVEKNIDIPEHVVSKKHESDDDSSLRSGLSETMPATLPRFLRRTPHKKKRRQNRLRAQSVGTIMDRRTSQIPNKRKFKPKNGWTPETENSCRKIANESATYKWLHNRNANILSGANDNTTLAVAIISAINGLTGLTGFLTQNYSTDTPWLLPVITIGGFLLSLLATVISLVQRTYDFPGKIDRHKTAEKDHNWLFFNIQGQLQKPIDERQNGNAYFGWISRELGQISSSEDIDDKAVEDFYNTFPGGIIPGLDTLDELELNEDNITPPGSGVSGSSTSSTSDTPLHIPLHMMDSDKNNERSDMERGQSYSMIGRGMTRRSSPRSYAKQFRAMKDTNLMTIVSNNSPNQNGRSRRGHNPDLLAYEMNRYPDE